VPSAGIAVFGRPAVRRHRHLEAVLRDGFDIRVHSLSLLANGPAGWVHSAMMIITGLLTVLGAACAI
jgi:hypothetical membrane protein